MKYLSEELILEILSRLPAKTIVSCKCVCKKWHNLVVDSYFANLHLSRPCPSNLILHDLLYSNSYDLTFSHKRTLSWLETTGDLGDQHHHCIINLDLQLNIRHLFVYGSVNGLICVSGDSQFNKEIYICNPITKEHLFFHKHTQDAFEETVGYGFGVSIAGEYKVVHLCQKKSSRGITEIMVYTLGTNQWRNVGQVPDWVDINYSRKPKGLSLNGRVHWLDRDIIYALDLDNEIFQLDFPSPSEEGHKFFPFMGVLKGCLSLLSESTHSDGLFLTWSVWVMEENGIQKSWHKKMKIEGYGIPTLNNGIWFPLCLIDGLKNTSILIVTDKSIDKLVAYSLEETHTAEETEIRAVPGLTNFMIYSPSFVQLQNFKSEGVKVLQRIRQERFTMEKRKDPTKRHNMFKERFLSTKTIKY